MVDVFGDLLNLELLLKVGAGVLLAFLTILIFFRWVIVRTWTLHSNLKRPVIILRPLNVDDRIIKGGEMRSEIRLLEASGLLSVETYPREYLDLPVSNSSCLTVIGFHPEMHGLEKTLEHLRAQHKPVIVYTVRSGDRVEREDHVVALKRYGHYLLANFPQTLLNHAFTTAATYPYEHISENRARGWLAKVKKLLR